MHVRGGSSWGKIGKGASMATCYSDTTIALPIVVQALSQRFRKLRRRIPIFEWKDDDLRIRYEWSE